jgi:hypothetical protein
MNISFALIILGLITGIVWRIKATRKNSHAEKSWAMMADVTFKWLLPFVVLTEVSSMDLTQWWLFIYGAAFIFVLYAIGIILTNDKHKSALLSTAEGGTIGFMFYNSLALEPLPRFFLIDMLGNGGALFSFIYWRISGVFKLWEFIIKNRLMLSMWVGLALNILAELNTESLHLKSLPYMADVSLVFGLIITLLISVIIGTRVKLNLSREIFLSKFFWIFWVIRILGMAISIALKLPLALTILFVLPPSFLLPVIYNDSQWKEKEYAANFIAACLPITFTIFFILRIIF